MDSDSAVIWQPFAGLTERFPDLSVPEQLDHIFAAARLILREVAVERDEVVGEYRYRQNNASCQYTVFMIGDDTRVCSCLVGRILHRLGLSIEILYDLDQLADPRIAGDAGQQLDLAPTLMAVLGAMQGAQDDPYGTWGAAYLAAANVAVALAGREIPGYGS